MAWGVAAAWRHAWTTDDAFISFRYARNLLRGLGLVYNPGERVEGYTNLSWTLWTALGMKLAFEPGPWCAAWGITAYAASLGLLAWIGLRLSGAARWLPVAAVGGAALAEWNVFATGGLETSALTFLILAGTALLLLRDSPRSRVFAGLVLALAALTRPDAAMFAALAAAWLLWAGPGPRRTRAALAFVAGFAVLWLPAFAWRGWYYGDLFPNTYYAKSAFQPWWSQGWFYVRLCLAKNWALPAGASVGAAGAVAAWLRAPRAAGATKTADLLRRRRGQALVLLLASAAGYTLLVARAGGDFMFMRLMIPVAPLCLLALELGLAELVPAGPPATARAAAGVVAGACAAGLLLTPSPFHGEQLIRGIADEWSFYHGERGDDLRRRGETLQPFFAGLPVRVAYAGGEAEIVYYADPEVAIEAATGLTDRFIAHQPLAHRGRVGHEKGAPLWYLLERRHVDMVLSHATAEVTGVMDSLPLAIAALGEQRVYLLHWEPDLVVALAQRGARIPNFPALVDQFLAELPSLPDSEVARNAPRLRRFYFNFVPDEARWNRIAARLPSGYGAR